MIEVLLFFIGASLVLYVVLGGADYGAGILELLPAGPQRNVQRKLVNEAMGPVWEANHMWLIIIVVILFMGFPAIFHTVMIHLHLPLVALLVGIVVRGTAFTFRHYDAVHDPVSQNIYSWLFGVSSLWTSYWLGVIAASLIRGHIDPQATDFWQAYMAPWWGLFPMTMGVFTSFIFSFLAAVYLIGESPSPDLKRLFTRRAFVLNFAVVISGVIVFWASYAEGGTLTSEFLSHPLAIACMAVATFLLFALWYFIRQGRKLLVRICAAGQAALILLGWYLITAPAAYQSVNGPVSFYQAAAPDAVLWQLNLALLVGSLLIFPSLFYLLLVFKIRK